VSLGAKHPLMDRRPLLLLVPVTLLFAFGCASLSDLLRAAEESGAFIRPELKFKSATVDGLSLSGAALTTNWELVNQNDIGIDLASIDYALEIEGQPLTSGKPANGLKIPARGSAPLSFPAQVQFSALASTLLTFLSKDVAHYTVKGTVGVNTPVGVLSLPLSYSGQFDVPKIPDLQFQNPRVTGISLTGATVEFPVTVTNKNAFPLPINSVGGALTIAGSSVGSLSLGNLGALESKGAKTVTVPLTLNFLSAGMAVARIVQGGTAEVGFKALIDSGDAKVPVDVLQPLTFQK
jgi:LEA14-like dessication related protein